MNDDEIVILDDAECIRILTAHSLLDQCRPFHPHNQCSVNFEHEGYWCVATCHVGHPLPADNGYVVRMLPKEHYTRDQAMRYFAERVVAGWTSDRYEFFPINPKPATN